MTFAQFRRMKPKYKIRIVFVCTIALLLVLGLLLGISACFSALRQQLNTTSISDITADNILRQSSMVRLAEAMKQSDPAKLLVIDSRLVCSEKGVPLELEMNLVSLVGTNAADYWQLTATGKKTVLRKTKSETQNRSSLAMRKLTFQDYYPALSRIGSLQLVQYLQENFPVGKNGLYLFSDHFDNNLEPQYGAYLAQGNKGLWISKIGALSEFTEAYVPVSRCTPMLVSTAAEDEKKTKPKRPVLLPAAQEAVLLLECGPYIN